MHAGGGNERERPPKTPKRSRKIYMPKYLTTPILVFTSVLLAGCATYKAYNDCDAAVDRRLDRLEISRGDVKKITFMTQIQTTGKNGDTKERGVDAYVRLHSCRGSLVIDMDEMCNVRQVYTRGKCDIPGVKHFW